MPADRRADADAPAGTPRLLGYVLADAPADIADGYPRQIFREVCLGAGIPTLAVIPVYIFDRGGS